MAENPEQPENESSGNDSAPSADKANARIFFQRAEKAAASRNYDYAIDLYIDGIKSCPDAVEDGHQKLRLVSVQRRAAGRKKTGMMEAMKLNVSGKDHLKAMLNAELLLAKEPGNISFMEGMLKNAVKLKLENTIMWLVAFMFEEVLTGKKIVRPRYELIRDALLVVAETADEGGSFELAVSALQRAYNVQEYLARAMPQDLVVVNKLRDISSRLTILSGKYDSADSFRDSVRDADSQKDLQETERLVQSRDRLSELIEKAKAKIEAEPNESANINALVDLLTKREDIPREKEAIQVLEKAYKQSDNYRFKLRADDIRLRQIKRKARELKNKDNDAALREFQKKRLRFEIDVFKERVEMYPTDLRMKYQYGERLFAARMFDEAIPIFQEAKADPKSRQQCVVLIGRCFLEKEYSGPAMDTFRDGIENHEIKGDEISKELHYWLARALEAEGQGDDARKIYGQLIQWDFNYRDVRDRMDALKK